MSDVVLYEKKGNVACITFNRPDAYNSVTKDVAMLFLAYMKQAQTDKEVRAVYITGNGKAFCAGQDLKEVIDPDNGLELENIVSHHFNPMALAVFNMPKPVIAAVNGVAAGAGANLALLCDIVVASEKASFLQAFSKIGLIPDTGGTYILPRLIGYQKALALTMLGDKVPATEAEKMNMIYKVFPPESFQEEAFAIADKLSNMPTKALALTKKAYQESLTNSFKQQLNTEANYQIEAGHSYDYNEGVRAFVEKRKAVFKGH